MVANQRTTAMKSTRRNHGAEFKAKGGRGGAEGRQDPHGVGGAHWRASQPDHGWKQHSLARASDVFGSTKPKPDEPDLRSLHARSGI